MPDIFLTVLFAATVLVFGVVLSAAFARIRFTKQNLLILLGVVLLSGGLQAAASRIFQEETVWKLYPLIGHLPLVLLLVLVYRRPLATALSAVFTTYLFCQPSKWLGVLVFSLTGSEAAQTVARILCLIVLGYFTVFHLSSLISNTFNEESNSSYIGGIIPTVYYLFDYITSVYTNLWTSSNRIVIEFLPFFLAVFYIFFCLVYHKEYEQKTEAQRREQITQIVVAQQAREIAAVRSIAQELRLLRHDMRMTLSSLAISIDSGELDTAREIIDAHITRIDGTKLKRFCSNDIVNYVLSDYAARCKEQQIPFSCSIALQEMPTDEMMLSSILSNALDNALNAQEPVPPEKRRISLMLKTNNGRLLLSIENPVGEQIVFADGLPVSRKKGHGYGTQSIRYLTQRLGGNCQFSVQDGTFLLRVVL